MIGKVLLTLAVIALAVLYWRKQSAARQLQSRNGPLQQSPSGEVEHFLSTANSSQSQAGAVRPGRALRWLTWSLVLAAVLGGSLYTYHRWQESTRELTVLLYRDGESTPVIYRVPRNALGERSFITHDGVRVTVSASERMEVVGL